MTCGWCRQEGHNRRTCQHYAEYRNNLNVTLVECTYCGETGHQENECQFRNIFTDDYNEENNFTHDDAISTLTYMHNFTQDLNINTDTPLQETSYTSPIHIDVDVDLDLDFDTPPYSSPIQIDTLSREPSYSPTRIDGIDTPSAESLNSTINNGSSSISIITTPPRNRHPIGLPPNAPIRNRNRNNRNIFTNPPLTKTLVMCVENPFPREDCPICMDDIKKTDSFTTRCGHMFHGTCMLQHMKHNNDCPCCRGILVV